MAEVVSPHALVDERARQDLPWVAHEQLEQVRFRRRELESPPAAARVHRAEIEGEIGEAEEVGRLLVESAAQERSQPGQQLLERERLRQVVVRTRVEPFHAVADGIACGQEENGDAIALAAEPTRDVQSEIGRASCRERGSNWGVAAGR